MSFMEEKGNMGRALGRAMHKRQTEDRGGQKGV